MAAYTESLAGSHGERRRKVGGMLALAIVLLALCLILVEIKESQIDQLPINHQYLSLDPWTPQGPGEWRQKVGGMMALAIVLLALCLLLVELKKSQIDQL